MNPASEDRLLGEYRLKELLSENPLTRTWLAEQVSVSRRVLVDELRAEQAHQRDAFLADVRAKAAVEHPLIGSVYEAVAEPGLCFFAHELLPGATLDDRRKAGEPFKPARLAHLLRRIAEAHLHHETLGQATSPLGLEHIHLDEQGVIRLDNLAIAGPRSPEQAARDIAHLGECPARAWSPTANPAAPACSPCSAGCAARAWKLLSVGNRCAISAPRSNNNSPNRRRPPRPPNPPPAARKKPPVASWRWPAGSP